MDTIPTHFHKKGAPEGQVSEIDIVRDGKTVDVVPDYPAPEGTEVSYLNGTTFCRYKMVDGTWRIIGSGGGAGSSGRFQISTLFESTDRFAIGGNASPTHAVNDHGIRIVPSATSGSYGFLFLSDSVAAIHPIFANNPTLITDAAALNAAGSSTGTNYIGIGEISYHLNATVFTGHQFGFKWLANGTDFDVWTTSGDGSAEEATKVITADGKAYHAYRAQMTAGQIEFFVDNVLVATHTIYLPSVDTNWLFVSSSNENTAVSQPSIDPLFAVIMVDI